MDEAWREDEHMQIFDRKPLREDTTRKTHVAGRM